jgi:ferrous iron transport protein B
VALSKLKVALIGNPNCGKSTLFNVLTGLNQSTANFPGATVDKKTGTAKINSTEVKFIDLPGAYSLNAKSLDEKIAVEILSDKSNEDYPDLTLFVADASNLKRSLFLATQIIDLKIPIVVALNMMDIVDKRGMEINSQLLSEKLGVKIIPISAREERGIDELKKGLVSEIKIPKEIFSAEQLKG